MAGQIVLGKTGCSWGWTVSFCKTSCCWQFIILIGDRSRGKWLQEDTGSKGDGSAVVIDSAGDVNTEPVFVDLLRSPESILSLAGQYGDPICLTGPLGCIAWRNRFLGIDYWAP